MKVSPIEVDMAHHLIVTAAKSERVKEIGDAMLAITKGDRQGNILMAGIAFLGATLAGVPPLLRPAMTEAVIDMLRGGTEEAANSPAAKAMHKELEAAFEKRMGEPWSGKAGL